MKVSWTVQLQVSFSGLLQTVLHWTYCEFYIQPGTHETCSSGIAWFRGDRKPCLSNRLCHALSTFNSTTIILRIAAALSVLLRAMFADVEQRLSRLNLKNVLLGFSGCSRRWQQLHPDYVLQLNLLRIYKHSSEWDCTTVSPIRAQLPCYELNK